jgi:hypothetical protein
VFANRSSSPQRPGYEPAAGDALESRSGRWSRRQQREFHIKPLSLALPLPLCPPKQDSGR